MAVFDTPALDTLDTCIDFFGPDGESGKDHKNEVYNYTEKA